MGRPQSENLDTKTFVGLVAYNMRRLRKEFGLGVSECARDIGISAPKWYVLEAARREKIDGATLDRIAFYFDVDVSELARKPRK